MEVVPDACWICLGDESDQTTGALLRPCPCPRWVHVNCMARWQLRCCGKNEERFCKFCSNELPDWRTSLFSAPLETTSTEGVLGEMEVVFGDKRFRCSAKSGPEGQREFMERVRRECGLEDGIEFSLNFCVKEPISGDMLRLDGSSAFDAAVLCSAAEYRRMGRQQTPSAPTSAGARREALAPAAAAVPPQGFPSTTSAAAERAARHSLAPASADDDNSASSSAAAAPAAAATSASLASGESTFARGGRRSQASSSLLPKPEEGADSRADAAAAAGAAVLGSRGLSGAALSPSVMRSVMSQFRRMFAQQQ